MSALPARVVVLAMTIVALAGAWFVISRPADPPDPAAAAARPTPTPTPTVTPTPTKPAVTKAPKPAVKRGEVYVEVYNNSGIKGLAGKTAGRASAVGWNVVGSDNWYGTISASTVYYPKRLEAEAKLLAKDLGISRLRSAEAPMRLDRLTVILTRDYS